MSAAAGDAELIAAAAAKWLRAWHASSGELWEVPSGWRIGSGRRRSIDCARASAPNVYLTGTPGSATAVVENGGTYSLTASSAGDRLSVTLDGVRTEYLVAGSGRQLWLAGGGHTAVVEEVREAPVRADDEHSGDAELTSPMPGSVVAVGVGDGDTVTAGTVVITIEAMKMEHALTAPVDGVVELLVAVADQVKVGQPVARVTATQKEES